jgi:hypothetical protein
MKILIFKGRPLHLCTQLLTCHLQASGRLYSIESIEGVIKLFEEYGRGPRYLKVLNSYKTI